MTDYYEEIDGNLHPGEIAKSIDINHMQVHIKDALRSLLDDVSENNSYILGSDENAFTIVPAPKFEGEYVDTYSLPEEAHYQKLSIRKYSYRQPIAKTKSSLYSIVCKIGNASNAPISVTGHIYTIEGRRLRTATVSVSPNEAPVECEFLFNIESYPTAPGLSHETLVAYDGKAVPPRTEEESYEAGANHTDEQTTDSSSIGVSQLFFVIDALNINEFDVAPNGDEFVNINDDSFYIVADSQGVYAQTNNDAYVEQNGGNSFLATKYSLWFKDIYATEPTYLCQYGQQAIIHGEKVKCIDTHVTIAGGDEYGNVLSLVYMDTDGHLHAANTKASNSTSIDKSEYEMDDVLPPFYLLIAKVLTYSDSTAEPLIIQNDDDQLTAPSDRTRLRSYNERIRRLEKQMNYVDDIAIPPRIKYTITDEDWIDKDKDGNFTDSTLYINSNDPEDSGEDAKDADRTDSYITTLDANGNTIVKTTKNDVKKIPVTLKDVAEKITGVAGTSTVSVDGKTEYNKDIKASSTKNALNKQYDSEDTVKLNRVSEMTNLTLDTKEGKLTLREKEPDLKKTVALTDKDAKLTEFNPWDDDAANRPSSEKVTPTERKYTVVSGKNNRNDHDSTYPGMTFYTKNTYVLKGLNIPIRKFENCSGVKFFIFRRQGPNNKTNTVWLEEKIYTSKVFSLKKAEKKGKYQYVDEGFTIKFSGKGLTLKKGQYVIIALPIPKSGEGSLFVETYKPKNSKDFCIKYHGTANAAHFLLKDRYQEIWYNKVSAFGSKATYEKKGSFISGTITFKNGDPITSVKPTLGSLSIPKGCKCTIYGSTGGKWEKLTDKKTTSLKTSGMSFKWKVEFESNGEDTPVLKYNKKKKYAIHFTLTRKAAVIAADKGKEYDTNMAITSVPINGDKVLRDYVGDPFFNLESDRFSNFEFARVWADKSDNDNLSIDISAADNFVSVPANSNNKVPGYSLHYCDLKLDDFTQDSVDYSNYDGQIEQDEHNLRLKIDTQNSYNDNDIKIFDEDNFVGQKNDIMSFEEITTEEVDGQDVTKTITGSTMHFTKDTASQKNQLLLKANFDNALDLTKYTGIKIGFKTTGTENDSIRGLAVYFAANQQTEAPSNNVGNPENVTPLENEESILEEFSANDTQLVSLYDGKIIKYNETVENDLQGVSPSYFQYVRKYDEANDRIIYVRESVHDVDDFKIYKLPTITYDTDTIYKIIEIDQDSTILKNVKEIGIIALLEDEETDPTDSEQKWFKPPENNLDIEIQEFKAIERDYYPIYDPKNSSLLKPADSQVNAKGNRYWITGKKTYLKADVYPNANSDTIKITQTDPMTTQIVLRPELIGGSGEMICYFNNTKATQGYKHIGVQIAADCYIPKNSLKLNLCADSNGANIIESINLPTLNYVYYPNSSGKKIPLSQVFKKIRNNEKIKSISITTTDKFREYMSGMFYNKTKKTWKKTYINIFLGKVVLYKAETIPIFHKQMRFKFYTNDIDGITTKLKNVNEQEIAIRKIGAVLEYR